MSQTIEDYDYALCDLVENPPLSHLDMVLALGRGEFIVEGKPSTFHDAEVYAQEHSEEKEVWDGLTILSF